MATCPPTPPQQPTSEIVPYRLHSRHPGTVYDPVFCHEIVHYFTTAVTTRMQLWEETVEKEYLGMKPEGPNFKGKYRGQVRAVCAEIPTFERFANSIGVVTATLAGWAAKYPDFAFAVQRCREVQKDFLIQGLVTGRMPAHGGIFVAKNITDMRDDHTLTVQAGPDTGTERPVLANKTPAELQALRELVEQSKKLGFSVELKELNTGDPDSAQEEWQEAGGKESVSSRMGEVE